MSKPLYEIEGELAAAIEQIELALEQGTEIPESVPAYVEALTLAAEQKRDALAWWLRQLEAHEAALEAEAVRIEATAKRAKAAGDRLRGYIAEVMMSHGFKSVSGESSKFTLVQNPPSVEVYALVPSSYERVIPESREPDKKRIGEALKAGKEVPGARLKDGAWRLKIGNAAPGKAGVAERLEAPVRTDNGWPVAATEREAGA